MITKIKNNMSLVSLLAWFVGFVVLVGWAFGVKSLVTVFPGLPSMKFNTALCFVLLSIYVWLKVKGVVRIKHFAALPFSVIGIALFSILAGSCCQQFEWIDEAIVKDHWTRESGVGIPGRMSLATAFNFLLLALGLLLLQTKKWRKLGQRLFETVVIISLMGVVGYVFQVPIDSKIPAFRSMAIHTALLFALLGSAAMFFQPSYSFAGAVIGKHVGSRNIRIILPVLIVALLLLGGVFKYLDVEGVMRLNSGGLAVFVSVILIISILVITKVSKDLNVADKQRLKAEIKLQKEHDLLERKVEQRTQSIRKVKEEVNLLYDRLRLATYAGEIGVWDFDIVNDNLVWDESMYALYGVDQKDFDGAYQAWENTLHPKDKEAASHAVQKAIEDDAEFDLVFRVIKGDSSVVYIRGNASVLRDENGKALRMVGCNWDVTKQIKAESKFRSLMEMAPDALVIVNKSGEIQMVNIQTQKLFGYTKEELVGQPVEVLMPERFKGTHHKHRDGFFAGPKFRPMGDGLDLWGAKKTGEEFPIEISLGPIETEDGMLVSAAIRDISDRKKAESKFRSLMEMAPDALVIVNQQGNIQMVNAQAERLFGYEKQSLLNERLEILIPERFRAAHPKHRDGFFHKPKFRPMGRGLELWGVKKDGTEFPIEISLGPIETEDGVLVSAAIRDISERKKTEQERKQTMKLVGEQNQRLLNFAHIVSHNLRTHSGNFEMILNLIEMEETAEEKLEMLEMLKSASGQLSETIDNLNEVVTIQTNLNQKTKAHNLLEYVDKTLVVLQASIETKEAEVTVNVPKELQIPHNTSYLESILLNFTTNALKYKHPDRKPEITFEAVEQEKYVVLSITDNGLGIDLERHGKKLFGMYKTFHGNENARGIGLFITKNQIEVMGGEISVESEVNKGTTFTIHFKK